MAKGLFQAAKEKGGTSSTKSSKEEVIVRDEAFHRDLHRLAELRVEQDALAGEASILEGTVRERSIKEFVKLYDTKGKNPGSFILRATGAKLLSASAMVIATDRYLKIGKEEYEKLTETYGADIAQEKTTYVMDSALVEEYGEIISNIIMSSKLLPDHVKNELIKANTTYEVTKGTISDLPKFPGTTTELLEAVRPVYQLKNVKIDDAL